MFHCFIPYLYICVLYLFCLLLLQSHFCLYFCFVSLLYFPSFIFASALFFTLFYCCIVSPLSLFPVLHFCLSLSYFPLLSFPFKFFRSSSFQFGKGYKADIFPSNHWSKIGCKMQQIKIFDYIAAPSCLVFITITQQLHSTFSTATSPAPTSTTSTFYEANKLS